VLEFYTLPAASYENTLSSASSLASSSRSSRHDTPAASPAAALSSLPTASSTTSATVGRQAQWRASFALKLYDVLQAPEFPELQRWMVRTGISTLRLLVQRFWHKENLGLMIQLLQQVSLQNLGKHLIGAALALEECDRQTLMRSMTSEEQSAIVAEFGRRIEQCAHNRTITKQLKKSSSMLISSGEQRALQRMKWRQQPSIDDRAFSSSPGASSGDVSGSSASSSSAASSADTAAEASESPPRPSLFSSLLCYIFQQHPLANAVQWNQLDLPPHLGFFVPPPTRTSSRLTAACPESVPSADDPVTFAPSASKGRQVARRSSNRKRSRRSESSTAAAPLPAAAVAEETDGTDDEVVVIEEPAMPMRQKRQTASASSLSPTQSEPASHRKRRRAILVEESEDEGECQEKDSLAHATSAAASEARGAEAQVEAGNEDSAADDASWRAIHASSDARIYPFNQALLPLDLSSYGRFHVAHASRVGRAVYYQR
jgi:hypothetical protein